MFRPTTSTIIAALAVAASVSLNACSSGGGIGSPVPSAPASPAGIAPKSAAKADVGFKIVLAAAPAAPGLKPASVKPLYLSPNTSSLQIAVTDPTSTVTNLNFDVTATSAGCTTTSGVITCVETGSVPVGADSFAVSAFSGAGETGSLLSTATLAQTIVANQANAVNLTLSGIVSSLQVAFGVSSVNGNHGSKTVPLSVSAFDASGAFIFGSATFTQPVALAADATSAPHVTLSKTSLASPADEAGLSFVYDGTYPLAQIAVTASATGATAGSAMLPVNAPPLPVENPSTLNFGAVGSAYTQTFSTTEADYSGTWTGASNCTTGNVATVSYTATPGAFSVRPNTPGTCTVFVKDSFGNASSVPVTVTSTSFTVN